MNRDDPSFAPGKTVVWRTFVPGLRFGLATFCVFGLACASARQTPTTPSSRVVASQPAADDREIMQLVARSLIDDSEFRPNAPRLTHFDSIVLHEWSLMMTSDAQIRNAVGASQYAYIAPDILESIVRRNAKPVSLSSLAGGQPIILVDDSVLREDWLEVPGRFRGFTPKGEIKMSLPGYSKDGRAAVVEISFGWPIHGASGVFYLSRTNDGWRIDHRSYVYYV